VRSALNEYDWSETPSGRPDRVPAHRRAEELLLLLLLVVVQRVQRVVLDVLR
jgi:hypothetical protein